MKDSISPFKKLRLISEELSQLRLSSEYQEQVNKNNDLLATIENEWKAFKIAFDESIECKNVNSIIGEHSQLDIVQIDSKIKVLDNELQKTKKILELDYDIPNNELGF